MSVKDTKQHLVQLLKEQDNRVIALSGKWGTGKSHLWREVKESSNDESVRHALYVSLFGVADIPQLKMKAVQSAIPKTGDTQPWADSFRNAVKAGVKVLKSVHMGFSALDEIVLFAVPRLLRGRVIVLDDIERKNDKLSIDEVMGFIDEFTQQHDARFVLILNDERLHGRAEWDILREKVIDLEIRLITTPAESFEIASRLTPTQHSERIGKAVSACGIDNIRVIRKIIRAVNRILADRKLDDTVLGRTIPSIVLLSAIHYKGMDDGPTFAFVLGANEVSDAVDALSDDLEQPSAKSRKARWNLLLGELGIHSADDFESLVVDYLESGQFDISAVTAIVDRYAAETEQLSARELGHSINRRLFWDVDASDSKMVEDASALIPLAHLLDAYTVTIIFDGLTKLDGGRAVAEQLVQNWIDHFRTLPHDDSSDNDFFSHPLHPDIRAELEAVVSQYEASMSVFDAVRRIVTRSGWGTREELAMKKSTVADFEATIRRLSMDDRSFFLRNMIGMRSDRNTYDLHFGPATDRFVAACRNIVSAKDSERLAALLSALFTAAGLDAELTVQTTPGITTAETETIEIIPSPSLPAATLSK